MRRFLVIVLVGIFIAGICGSTLAEEKVEKKYGPEIGMYLKDFSLINPLDGKKYSLKDLSKDGKDVALVFMQTACSLCLAELREFKRGGDRLEENLNVVLVSVDIEGGRIKPYLEANDMTFRVIHDGDGTLLDAVKFNSTPGIVVVDSTGKIKVKKPGFDSGEVRSMIKEYSK